MRIRSEKHDRERKQWVETCQQHVLILTNTQRIGEDLDTEAKQLRQNLEESNVREAEHKKLGEGLRQQLQEVHRSLTFLQVEHAKAIEDGEDTRENVGGVGGEQNALQHCRAEPRKEVEHSNDLIRQFDCERIALESGIRDMLSKYEAEVLKAKLLGERAERQLAHYCNVSKKREVKRREQMETYEAGLLHGRGIERKVVGLLGKPV